MLLSLEIKNYAIIDHATMHFDRGLNIITGETGAGKSILIGALGLTLGERADSKVLFSEVDKCFVEATFNVSNYQLEPFFEMHELDFEEHTIIRREITPSGKSRAFVNDTPVTVALLKELASQLVNLHNQQETGSLNEEKFQLNLLDFVAKNDKLKSNYQKAFTAHNVLLKQLESVRTEQAKNDKDYQYNAFLLQEITEAQLVNLDLESMENDLRALSNAESIKSALFQAKESLDNENQSALSILQMANQHLEGIADYNEKFQQFTDRLNSCIIELEDLKNDLDDAVDKTEIDEEQIQLLSDKVDSANRLIKKHHLSSLQELEELREELENKTSSVASASKHIERLESDVLSANQTMISAADALTASRKNATKLVAERITSTLHKVGMPTAHLDIQLTKKERPSASGMDAIEMLFSANKGFPPKPLKHIASGGELSRVMLSIKSLLADAAAMPTLIFDEIDTGISGETAAKVAEVFKDISIQHQLISITHLPQIASKANRHFFISKTHEADRTHTHIATLQDNEHVEAIARMLSGETVSAASLDNAKQLIG